MSLPLCVLGCSSPSEPVAPPFPDPPIGDPIRLVPGTVVGQRTFADGDMPQGGQGQPVESVACDNGPPEQHIHAHVSLFVNGTQIAIPAQVGIVAGRCRYWLHTHDATGIVHIEPTRAMSMTLGQFFGIWGQQLGPTNVAGFRDRLTTYVKGTKYEGNARAVALASLMEVTLIVGRPPAELPRYIFPYRQ